MPSFTAKDVQRLRQVSGAGMMDAKNALTETDGVFDDALRLLQEKGLASTAKRSDRENNQGAVALGSADGGRVAALVELKSETDFVAKSPVRPGRGGRCRARPPPPPRSEPLARGRCSP